MLRVFWKSLKTSEGIGRLLIISSQFFPLQIFLSRYFKVSHTITGSRALHLIVQRVPLIGQHLVSYQLHLFFPKIISYLYASQGKRFAEIFSVHSIHPPSAFCFPLSAILFIYFFCHGKCSRSEFSYPLPMRNIACIIWKTAY